MAAPVFPKFDVARIASMRLAKRRPRTVGVSWLEDEVHMIRYERQ